MKKNSITTPNSPNGFVLPVILVICTGLMFIGLSLIQSTTSVRDSLNDAYFNRLASEAAESGATYANYCLAANSFNATWGPSVSMPPLTQKTDCTGTAIASAPSYILNHELLKTSFEVGDLEARSDGAIIISSVGKVEQTPIASSTPTRQFTIIRKQVVDWKVYQASVSSSGTSKTCSIISNELYCWGKNSNGTEDFSGQLGDGTTTDSLTPVKVVQNVGVLANKVVDYVVSAQFHNCALAEGKVYCWGKNNNGQLGNNSTIDSSVPVVVQGLLVGKVVTAIGASGNTSCAITEGKIYCWGSNSSGTVGANSTTTQFTIPTAVVATGNATELPTNYVATKLSSSGSRSYNMCAIADGKAFCWGNNLAGQIGNGVANSTLVRLPTKVVDTGVLAGKTVTAISQDGFTGGSPASPHVCAVADGGVYCWGENLDGQLGRNNTTDSSVPVAVDTSGVLAGKTIQNVVVGLRHSCALANSKVYCWGNNTSGQLGNSTNTLSMVPVAVSELAGALLGKTVTAVGGGSNRGCAIADLQSYCWGLNTDGQIGDGTQTNRNRPTESIFLRPKAPVFIF